MKKLLFSFVILVAAAGICGGFELTSIRHSISPEKIRVVLDINGSAPYRAKSDRTGIHLTISGAKAADSLQKYLILDGMIDGFDVKNSGSDLLIDIRTSYPVEGNAFTLKDPFRIIVDLPRPQEQEPVTFEAGEATEEAVIQKSEIAPAPAPALPDVENIGYGISLYKLDKIEGGLDFRTFALLVDPAKTDVMPVITVPAIKGKGGASVFGGILNFFGLSDEKAMRYDHFTKKRVATFAKMMGATAGINGSYFYGSGTPVGALIVNRQIISSPLYNRTALIINDDGTCSIDQLRMEGYLKLKNGETLGFSGVNQPIKNDEIIVYTPDYQSTDPSFASTNIIVVNGSVEAITYGETKIPRNGFVICAHGVAGDTIKEYFKKGDPVKWFFMSSPPLDSMLHAIAAGPRLVSGGKPYVTSKEERFRSDIAKGKAARTAVGITEKGNLLFVVVEGNGKRSGATLEELSQLMINLGAVDAMNLDGGGSSTMVVKGSTLNKGASRPVGNAIVIRPRS